MVMSWRPVLVRAAAAVAAAVLLATLPAVPGSAAGPSTGGPAPADVRAAQAEARRAAAEVNALTSRLARADRAYADAAAAVGRSVTDGVLDDAAGDDATRRADAAADAQARAARALYMSGGPAGLVATVLRAHDPRDLALRTLAVQQALPGLSATPAQARSDAGRSRARARRAAHEADASVVVAADLGRRVEAVDALLHEAQAALDRLSARARGLAEAQRAAQALAAARAAAAASRREGLTRASAQGVPPEYATLYRSAAATCPGMPWTLLAAVGQVESGHGRNGGPSSAGAVGPMQFLPATFRAFAVDGDADGRTDPLSPADSVFTAARYLCAGGAGSPSGVRGALFRYNHAQWYVDLVLGVESRLVQPS